MSKFSQADQDMATRIAETALFAVRADSEAYRAGPFEGKLADLLLKLRENGLTWIEILNKISPILQALLKGATWQEILELVFALFKKKPPAPEPTIDTP